jgi:hypothetical protein
LCAWLARYPFHDDVVHAAVVFAEMCVGQVEFPDHVVCFSCASLASKTFATADEGVLCFDDFDVWSPGPRSPQADNDHLALCEAAVMQRLVKMGAFRRGRLRCATVALSRAMQLPPATEKLACDWAFLSLLVPQTQEIAALAEACVSAAQGRLVDPQLCSLFEEARAALAGCPQFRRRCASLDLASRAAKSAPAWLRRGCAVVHVRSRKRAVIEEAAPRGKSRRGR